MKQCSTCKSEFPSTDFYKDIRKPDGLYPSCKHCHLTRTKRWKTDNPEKQRIQQRIWRKNNPNKYRAAYLRGGKKATIKRQNNPALMQARREYLATWRSKNRPKLNNISHLWRKTHPEKINDYVRLRRARLRTNGGAITKSQWLGIKQSYSYSCAECSIPENDLFYQTKQRLTLDHIIPVTRGGTTTIDNIQPLCFSCNLKKSNHPPQDRYATVLAEALGVSKTAWKLANLLS